MKFTCLLFSVYLLCFLPFQLLAYGPAVIAKANQDLWPDHIDSPESFNMASRYEILVFIHEFSKIEALAITTTSLGVKKINLESVVRWQEQSQNYWLNAYQKASLSCSGHSVIKDTTCDFNQKHKFSDLVQLAQKNITIFSSNEKYKAWYEMSQSFYATYLKEQVRLAALFPGITSEILPVDVNELNAQNFDDGEFLMTLDDGPTAKAGFTDKYTQELRNHLISAIFFTLQSPLKNRLEKSSVEDIKKLYAGHCLASHGSEHKSHQKWSGWKKSLEDTQALIKQILPDRPIFFRPPYGQRTSELNQYQKILGKGPVVMWNIDSQDWSHLISAKEMKDRVIKLMLLWRKGILLFHDVHDKSLTAIPSLADFAKKSQLKWIDCQINRP